MTTTDMKGKRFEVGITYCDDTNFLHLHTNIAEAAKEYADMLTEAVSPTTTEENARHVRMVTLVVRDQTEAVVRHINTGVIECEDRQ